MADADAPPPTIRLADYQPPTHQVDEVALEFDLGETETRVRSWLSVRTNGEKPQQSMRLDGGSEVELLDIRIDGEPLSEARYARDDGELLINDPPGKFILEVETRIHPESNTALEGLYRSGDMFCTQCEAEGFRHITFFPDRPDVMAVYTTTIIADPQRYPVLLCNGNREDAGTLEDGRQWVRWHDPHPKPSYLFALVAGDLHCHNDRHVTRSGRTVDLQLYVEHRNAGRTAHAIRSLKNAMRWDEQVYGLEYDLDTYMIVAVDDFNMGAMENKGLNIFNTVCVLADESTATDQDFETVEAVIGHEYFHNWTGNRVTCRDWFQLSLKEGLTVFREHQFCSDMGSQDVHRIGEVRALRAAQFPEDAGPMAHPVRPDSYVEISNFYTPTVYQKGAEVIRMYHTLLGNDGYMRGIRLYLQRHDGQAVTCDHFRAAMADANDRDLEQFGLWYAQAGTPLVTVRDDFNPDAGTYSLHIRQSCPATPGQPEKQPMHIPLVIGLLDPTGQDCPVTLEGESAPGPSSRSLELREPEHVFRFTGLDERPVPSLLRGFSAPVRLDYPWTDRQLGFLLAHDSDGFTRWEAGQQLAINVMLRKLQSGAVSRTVPDTLSEAMARVLDRAGEDPAFAAEALRLPSEQYLGEQMETVDVDGVHRVREALRNDLADHLRQQLLATYRTMANERFKVSAEDIGRRSLRNTCLDYLAAGADGVDRVLSHYRDADNMTDRLTALALLCHTDVPERLQVLEEFHQQWKNEPLVIHKWFRVQAHSMREDTPERVRALLEHPDFSIRNPNRVRSLVGAFAQGNQFRFHRSDGAGYALLAEVVMELNAINPQVAARIVLPLTHWKRQPAGRQKLMRKQLERIGNTPKLSKDVFEIVTRGLEA